MPCIKPKPIKHQPVKFELEPFGYNEGDYVLISKLNSRDWVKLRQIDLEKNAIDFAVKVVECAVVDENGAKLFSKDEALDLDLELVLAISEKVIEDNQLSKNE